MGLVLLLLHCGMGLTQQALQSALTSAAGSGRLEVVRLLLQYGADINDDATAFSETGPLGAALKGGHSALAEALLTRGAHADFTALMHALQWKASSRVVQLLLQRGISDGVGGSIFIAAQASLQELVELLLNSDKPDNEAMATRLEAAVCGAAMQANLQLLQFLLEPPTKFLPGRADAVGRRIMQQVLDRGLDAAVHGRHYNSGPVAHDSLARYSSALFAHQRAAVVAFLLKQGADPDYESGQLLLIAAQQRQETVLHELLQAGDKKSDRALELAAGSGDAGAVSLLLRATTGPVDPTGAALLASASAGHVHVYGMLLQRGANVAAALRTAGLQAQAGVPQGSGCP
jgi:ankyrin repeat protein